jgi:flagellar hook-associated protein 3 FlgL
MRVTSNTLSSALIDQLNRLSWRQIQLQNQAASGQRVQLPEDDPGAARQVLDLQAEASSVAQFQKNIATEQNRAGAAYSAIAALKTISDRVGEIATLADGTKSQEELTAYGKEVTQLIQQAVQIANTRHNGSYVFAGTRSAQPAFTVATDVNGQVTGVTYQGNQNLALTEIAEGVTVTSQVPGANTTGSGPRGLITDTASGADFFNHLISLQNHLLSGDVTSIASTDRAQLTADEDNILSHISQNGVVQSRLEAESSLMSDRATGLNKQVSNQADADLTQTLVQLSATQNAYQAALQSGAKIMNLSLMDYLR